MVGRNIENLLSYHCLTGPLITNPVTDMDKVINKLRRKFRSYTVPYDVEDGAVMIPNMFADDFGDKITRFAKLVDPKNNQFEVLVDVINGCVFFTKGWRALRDFYGIGPGAWVTLVFIRPGLFTISLKDSLGRVMKYPMFNPPMHFVIDKTNVPSNFNNDLLPFTAFLSYRHDINNFQFSYEKRLSDDDVSKGFLMLVYEGFCEMTLNIGNTLLKLVDECGNSWGCILMFGTESYNHYKIGGQWKRFVKARKLEYGARIKLGAPVAGSNETLYVTVFEDYYFSYHQ